MRGARRSAATQRRVCAASRARADISPPPSSASCRRVRVCAAAAPTSSAALALLEPSARGGCAANVASPALRALARRNRGPRTPERSATLPTRCVLMQLPPAGAHWLRARARATVRGERAGGARQRLRRLLQRRAGVRHAPQRSARPWPRRAVRRSGRGGGGRWLRWRLRLQASPRPSAGGEGAARAAPQHRKTYETAPRSRNRQAPV